MRVENEMANSTNIDKLFEEKKRKYVMDFIKEKNLTSQEENVIFAPKVFVVSSVLRWCLDSAVTKTINRKQWEKYKTIVAQYIAGIVDIKWNGDSFEVFEVKYESKEDKPVRARRKPRNPRD
jgi:hypothetical protein